MREYLCTLTNSTSFHIGRRGRARGPEWPSSAIENQFPSTPYNHISCFFITNSCDTAYILQNSAVSSQYANTIIGVRIPYLAIRPPLPATSTSSRSWLYLAFMTPDQIPFCDQIQYVTRVADVELRSKPWLSKPRSYGSPNDRQSLVNSVDMIVIGIVRGVWRRIEIRRRQSTLVIRRIGC